MSTIGKLNLSNDQLILDDEESWVLPAGDPGRWLPIHAIMILGLRDTEAAGLAIANAIATSHRIGGDEMDWVASYWPALLRNKPASIAKTLTAWLDDRETPEYVRIVSAESRMSSTPFR
jgi:hypothetical protein